MSDNSGQQPILTGPALPPVSGNKPSSLVVLLHGYGADGDDLISLAPFFANDLTDTLFYSPHAPQPCEMGPFGRQWFSLADYDPELMRRSPDTMVPAFEAMLAGAEASTPILEHSIETLCRENDIAPEKVAFVGFSQGTMMSLHLGLRRAPPPACIIGFSGALLGADQLSSDTLGAEDLSKTPPIHLIHGDADPVVPVEASRTALTQLKDLGLSVSLTERPDLQHGIDPEGANHARHALIKALGG
ncbi:MAG: alpha/beta hydrolase [Rhodospirillaceae bacterium]